MWLVLCQELRDFDLKAVFQFKELLLDIDGINYSVMGYNELAEGLLSYLVN